jgi:outer membrane protein assembly factor BamB
MDRIGRKIVLSAVVLVASVAGAVVAPGHRAAAVEGGKPVAGPWAVFIQSSKGSGYTCTGSLISAEWVLTAAHCAITGAAGHLPVKDSVRDFTVTVDAHGANEASFGVSEIKLFDPNVKLGSCGVADVDLALMKLDSPIPASSHLTPLAIVPPSASGSTGGTLPVLSPSPVDYGYGLTHAVIAKQEGCSTSLKDRVTADTLNRTIPGDYSADYPCAVPDDWCLEHSAGGKSYSMPGDSGGPWVIPLNTKIPGGGKTENLLEFGVESLGQSCVIGKICPNDAAVDLSDPAVNTWIANTAGTVLARHGTSAGTCSPRCIVTSSVDGTQKRWEVESDGFAHPIDDQVYSCLVGQQVSVLKPLTSFQLGEIPHDSLPATCLAGTDGPANWPQLHQGPSRTGYQADETTIDPANVGSLSAAKTYAGDTAPLIADGVLYVATNRLYAYNAAGAKNCSAVPSSCTPLWSAPAANFDGMTIAGGVVFVTDAEGVQAYDASGVTNCSGTPKVCAPIWATSTNDATGTGFTPGSGSPVVASGVLYVPGYGDGIAPSAGGAYVAAFDASGSKGCQVYQNFGKICVPMWTTTGLPVSSGNSGSPAIANGVIYLANGALFAFKASGCSPAPTTGCPPSWTTPVAGTTYSAPAVADGTVYVGTWNGPLYAYDAAGCGSESCSPRWTADTGGTGGTPAVVNGILYTVSADGTLAAFDAAGSTNCSGTAEAKKCTPLWTSAPGGSGYVTMSSPAVANGVVYFSSTNGGTYGYDADGSLNCSLSSTARTCGPLWSAVTGFIGGGSPAVVAGVVYIDVSGNGEIYAYSVSSPGK